MKTLDDLAGDIALRLEERGIEACIETEPQRCIVQVGDRRFVLAVNLNPIWVILGMVGDGETPISRDDRGVADGVAFIVDHLPKT